MAGKYHIGIDVGGTFTDFVLSNMESGELSYHKEPSVPSDPSMAVLNGITNMLRMLQKDPSDISLIMHGTTLALNTIIQRRGARTALVVSSGFGSILEIGRGKLPDPLDMFGTKEEPLISQDLVFEIPLRVDFNGNYVSKATAVDYDALCNRLKELDIEAVAISLLHSYRHPQIEDEALRELRARMPDVRLSTSSSVWPEAREYERTLTAVMNAYVHPLMDQYYSTLESRLSALGITAPIYATASNGGSLSLSSARERPIDTVLSGPASGVSAATALGNQREFNRIVTFDMGGTSSDISLCRSGSPEYTTKTAVGDFPLVVPVVNVFAIGAGGGSIIWVDEQGIMKVGPHSAGANPGPICYGLGGTQPTLTDCFLVIDCLDANNFLGGRMALDKEAARTALAAIGARIGIQGDNVAARTADAAIRVATAMMATQLTKGTIQRGEDARTFALMPFGGAGPLSANLLADEVGMSQIVVPAAPGTFCAMGAILADVKRDYVRTLRRRFSPGLGVDESLRQHFADLAEQALVWVKQEGEFLGPPVLNADVEMKYVGQAFEISVPLSAELRALPDLAEIAELYHREHEKHYGFRDLTSAMEIVTIRLRVTAQIPRVEGMGTLMAAEPPRKVRRKVFHNGEYIDAAVVDRKSIARDTEIVGPAVIEQDDSTCWVIGGWTAKAVDDGSLLISRI